MGHGDGPFPTSTLTDWVSYAGQVSEVEVLSEQEIPPPQAVLDRKEGYVGRKIQFRINTTFWTSSAASPTPREMAITVAGWVLKGERRVLFALAQSPRLEVGGRYVMPLVSLLRASEVEWGPLSTESVFAVADDPIASADVRARGNSPLARQLSMLPESELRRVLVETPPDPIAMKYWHLPPLERVRAVASERR